MTKKQATPAGRDLLKAGLEHYRSGDRHGAEACFRQALTIDPSEPTALYVLALVRLELGDVDEAEVFIESILSIRPDHAQSRLTLAAIRSRKGLHAAAAEEYRRFLVHEPRHGAAWIALSQSLLASGDAAGAVEAAQSAVEVVPDHLQAHLAHGGALAKVGRPREAAAAYREAIALDPESAPAHLGLAVAMLQLGQPQAALPSADRALTLDNKMPFGWLALGIALRGAGDPASAMQALEHAIELDPKLAAAHAQLGGVYDELDRPLQAEARLLEAVALEPNDKGSHLNLSSLYCRADQYELGARHALLALQLDPHLVGAHQNLAHIYAYEGRETDAKCHRDLAYRACNLFSVPSVRAIRRVLVLASTDRGNSPDRYLLPQQRYSRYIWFVEYANEGQSATLPSHDIVFNAIGDHDSTGATAGVVQRFLKVCSRPVLNPPDKIARTPRHLAPMLFSGLRQVVVPATARLSAAALAADGAVAAVRAAGIATPLLMRPIGSHGGDGLTLLRDLDDAQSVQQAVAPGRDHYLTAFHDFRSADGLYRKYRMFLVDRRPYPYHLAIGEDWLLHYQNSGTADHPEYLAEELRFLEDPEAAIGRPAVEAIRAIGQRMDLEFCGVDFTLLPDGRVLLFEANATMLAHTEPPDGPLAYKNVYIDRILQAFWALLEQAAPKLAA